MRILVLHGPNLNLLGKREPAHYGAATLDEINDAVAARARDLGVDLVECLQSNSESELIERIHKAMGTVDGIVFNPAAFTHTSVALRDALLATSVPFVEIHLSNVAAREAFRHRSFFSDIAVGVVSGFGAESYLLGLQGLVKNIGRGGCGKSE